VTLKKEGLGRWTNLGVGMVGALIGGLLLKLVHKFVHVNLGLGEIKVTFEDLLAAFLGSLLFVVAWWLAAKLRGKKKSR
jgi:uncharacterized membrane protein YeaQ/YmgE (transglycosylase-associated protein family)